MSVETSIRNGASEVLLTEREQQQLAAWNATEWAYPREACVPQLVAIQAAATPDAKALIAADQALSYTELNQRANQLAHYLQSLGVGREVLVGLCVERSVDLVVGLLGILKAGGAYLPLDPAYPADRLAFMLEDAHAPVLVTQQHLAPSLTVKGAQTVCLDSDAALLARQSVDNPATTADPADLAYVIYTSGSTGRPKGVEITHDGLLNLVCWHQQAFSVTAVDRATQVTSPAFDATGWELWPYLTCGASVYLPDEQTRLSPELMRDWLLQHGITISFLSTPLAEGIMSLEWPQSTALRILLTGADTLHHYPSPALPFALINNYGPTESTVVATSGRVPAVPQLDSPPTIGRPIANTKIYILDEDLRLVPVGEPGELYIGGAGVARGYLNRPELTAEKFIPNPFSNHPAARLYRTGDLARYLPDGQITFLGRSDDQIKIRGYRIEPDEIVCVLNTHQDVQTCLVIAREDAPGDKRLIAYLVLSDVAQVTASYLRELLLAHLPDYMVPAAFVVLEALPLTPNGKVDRRALPLPGVANTLGDGAVALPTTPTEQRLVELVCPLLGTTTVGVDDNFFLLGGNSFMGAQLVARVGEIFQVELPLRTLFEAPTVRQLATEVQRLALAQIEALSEEEALRLLAQR